MQSAENPYIHLTKNDILNQTLYLLERNGYFLREDGKIDHPRKPNPSPPWLYVKHAPWHDCHIEHKILFDIILNQSMVPSHCMECWKVVVMPRTVEELFRVYELQKRLNRPCKCGIEGDRTNTNRLYGAYFYNRSLEEGRYRHKEVCDAIRNDLKLSNDIPVILKRGCTEFEQSCGPSDTWEIKDGQIEVENIVKSVFTSDNFNWTQPEHVVCHIQRKWLHKAFQWGDTTYLKFTDGKKFFEPPVMYHEEE